MSLIQAKNVSFRYNQEHILEDVSFDIHEGEFIGIIGPNGSGKTTLLKILLGLLKPEQGTITFMGKPISTGQQSQVGYIPQKVTQLETRFPITVEEVVALGRVNRKKLFHWSTSADHDAVTRALEAVDLVSFRKRLITDLSGGQQQRAFIAKALASEPKLLLLDEPTVGIDEKSQENFYALLSDLNKKHNITIVIVSHDVDVVINEVSTVLCLNKTLVYHGDSKKFLTDTSLEKIYGKHKKFVIHSH